MTNALRQLDPEATHEGGVGALPPLPNLGPRSRTRQQVWRLRLAVGVVGVTWLAAMLFKTGLRPDHQELPWAYAYGLPALMYASGAGMLGLALAGGRDGVGARGRWVRLAVVALPILFALSALWTEIGAHTVVPASYAAAWSAHLACGLMTLALGGGPFAVALIALRRAFPTRYVGRGALVGLCCGLAAAATIHLHCPVAMSSHILLSHGAPLVALTFLGAMLARRFFRT